MSKDNIFFRHIDQNVSQSIFIERKVNMIQEIVFLNDENTSNYIIILTDLHKHLTKWWKRVEKRNLTSDDDIVTLSSRVRVRHI